MTLQVNEPSAKYLTNAGYKRTDGGVIPDSWDVKPLRDISSISSGGTPSRTRADYWNGDIPWITTSEVDFSRIEFAEQFISNVGLQNSAAKLLPPGTLLLALYGQGKTRGKVGVLGIAAATNQACAAIEVKRDVSPDFLLHFLTSLYDAIRGMSNGGSQDNLNSGIVKSILVPVPSSAEQRAIAAALSDVDALIAGLEKLIAKKRDLKQAAMQQLLTGQTRLPRFSGKWAEACLGDLARIQRGASPRPIESPVWFDDTSSVGWVRISDVTSAGMYLTETQQRLSPLGIQHSRPVERGNLIMSICATVGRPVITEIDVCIHDGFVVFDEPQADKHFLYYVLKWIEPNWAKQGQTGSQMNLNTPLINGTKIMLPSTDEQKAIASALSEMDVDLTAQESRLAKTRDLKQGMMQELLTGRTRLV